MTNVEVVRNMESLCNEGYKFHLEISKDNATLISYENPQGFTKKVECNINNFGEVLSIINSGDKCCGKGKCSKK